VEAKVKSPKSMSSSRNGAGGGGNAMASIAQRRGAAVRARALMGWGWKGRRGIMQSTEHGHASNTRTVTDNCRDTKNTLCLQAIYVGKD
jgi:hypothetical protein